MTRFIRFAPVAPVILIVVVAGCSSRTEPWPTATGTSDRSDGLATLAAHHDVPPSATESAEPLTSRSIRPVPEVISKPRLFELPSSVIQALPPLEATAIAPIEFPSQESPTVTEIRGMMRQYLGAMRRHDATALAAHWSDSGESVNIDTGETTRGRETIRQVFAALFEKESDASLTIDVTAVRPIRDEVAVIDGVSKLSCPGEKPARSRFSAVVVKADGRWLLESVREARMPSPNDPAAERPLAELAWLTGHWNAASAEAAGASTHCFWSARDAYLVRSHTVPGETDDERRYPDRVVSLQETERKNEEDASPRGGGREITEIVGWDPVARSLRSWIFSSDGGFGEGFWTIDGDRARVRVDGTLADGSPVSGTITISRLGPDEVSCILSGERIDELVPPGGDMLRTARASVGP